MAPSLDLWTPRFPTGRLHPHFRALAARPSDRQCINAWADGFEDVNNTIVDEFQTKFSPAFWELYLYATFRSLGFRVSRPADRPDFVLNGPQAEIVVEAKVAEAGVDQPPEWTPKQASPLDLEAFYARTTERLASSVWSKIEAYRKYSVLDHVKNRPFLLCVGAYDDPWFVIQHARAMWRVLYQYDQPTFTASDMGDLIETGHQQVRSFRKANGTVVPLGFFLKPEHADISAVFFNPRATASKLVGDPERVAHERDRVFASWYMPTTGELEHQDVHPSEYRETLADGGYLLLNPYASRPIDAEAFFEHGVTVCSFDPDLREMTSNTPTPFLFERVTASVLPDEFAGLNG